MLDILMICGMVWLVLALVITIVFVFMGQVTSPKTFLLSLFYNIFLPFTLAWDEYQYRKKQKKWAKTLNWRKTNS